MPRRNRTNLPELVLDEVRRPNCSTLADNVIWYPVGALIPLPDNPRKHSKAQIDLLARNIGKFGIAKPIIIDENRQILMGHAIAQAARQLAILQVPTLSLSGLTEGEKRALAIADNRIAEDGSWDPDLLRNQIKAIIDLNVDPHLTGFSAGEIDLMLLDPSVDNSDDILPPVSERAISRPGDLWILGKHRLLCGDSTARASYLCLLGDERAEMVVTDPPYNVRIQGHARGRSAKQHREFAMASGEMSPDEFQSFLNQTMALAVEFSTNGSIHYWFMDWRHLTEILPAGQARYTEWKNLLVWRKANAGQGSFYRSHHELILVFKNGAAAHINNFGLGANGRYRTNVLDYPGGATPDATRQEELAMHPTVKPVALIADLICDCSKRDGLILDLFGGSGTTILAAERAGRRARVIELDPLYVDLAIRRWQKMTGAQAWLASSAKPFDLITRGVADAS